MSQKPHYIPYFETAVVQNRVTCNHVMNASISTEVCTGHVLIDVPTKPGVPTVELINEYRNVGSTRQNKVKLLIVALM